MPVWTGITGTSESWTGITGTTEVWTEVGDMIYRDDPTTWDYTVGSFTTDATWRDLDLSSIIDSGAKFVLLQVQLTDNAAGSIFAFRKNGDTNAYNTQGVVTQVANIPIYGTLLVGVDTSGYVEYYGSNLTFTTINVVVCGWSM